MTQKPARPKEAPMRHECSWLDPERLEHSLFNPGSVRLRLAGFDVAFEEKQVPDG